MVRPADACQPSVRPSREVFTGALLVAATAVALTVCYLLVHPFLPALAWALALATVAGPLHLRIAARMRSESVAAALTTVLLGILLVALAWFVGDRLVRQAVLGIQVMTSEPTAAGAREALRQWPRLDAAVDWMWGHVDLRGEVVRLSQRLPSVVSASAWAVAQAFIALFATFYFLRDRAQVLGAVRALAPLTDAEMDGVARRVGDTLHAIIFGTLTCAVLQGTLGGLMFWWLGLPAPVLWGGIMSALAVVPVLGAFVVWLPAAVYLGITGHWIQALIMGAWGGLVISFADNLIYPVLVGRRIRLHTLAVFFALLGGVSVFGPSGVILGPLVLALAVGLMEVWRRRLAA